MKTNYLPQPIPKELKQEFKYFCRVIIDIPTKPGAMINCAKAYAEAGLGLWTAKEITTQILYILANLSTWRGEQARTTKASLRELHNKINAELS